MSDYVLDASALLVLINDEPGNEKVRKYLPHSCMSTVNISEVAAVLHSVEIPKKEIERAINELVPTAIPFDETLAYQTAQLKHLTKKQGLSLGDRACLALGQTKKIPVVTVDKIWNKLELGIKVILVR